jgi:Zn-dependent peptidase ImmA (M78 family)
VRYNKLNFRHSIKVKEKAEIEAVVKSLRKKWMLGNSVLYNVVELLEDLGIKVLLFDADDAFDGLSTWVDKKIPLIVINRKKHEHAKDRLRFTALHELGHLVLDIHDLPEKEQERLCHYFAAAMLMPKEVVFFELGENRSNISFRELGLIKKQYGLSIQSLLFRARDLGIISDRTFRISFKMLSQYGWRKREPEEFDFEGSEKSNRFDQLLLKGVTEGVLTSSKAASLKNMKLAEFRRYLADTNFSK